MAETLSFVYKFKDHEGCYEEIRRFVDRMVKDVRRFFAQDIYDLSLLEWELLTGRYKITSRGRILLGGRLRSTYSDGTGYHIRAGTLRRIEVRPITDLKARILESGRMGLEAAALSRRIGGRVDVEVRTPLTRRR